ncbi:TIGR00730 family Rossman fold protein [Candidatus Saccharibacteria bacterium]|nr:MAG: TIGR00730 family Rossman fold protein [Candidatus Saccharibacteria bacterium]
MTMHTHKHEHKVWEMSEAQKKAIAKSTRELRTSDEEFEAAFEILQKYPKRVTFFGSARLSPRSDYYHMARDLAAHLADAGFAIISGGGHGIMEASNRGAYEGEDVSIGFNIKLPHEQHLNPYTTDSLKFNFFFTRKVMMTFYAHAFICFPGGFGTLDEAFEILTLIQTGKMPKVPVIFIGNSYWKDLDKFIQKHLLREGLISPGDEKIYTITEDYDVMCSIINKDYDK